jgi:1-deoxy-D-xylulose-5-phosphate synthase
LHEIPIGRARVISEGSDIAILSIGHVGNFVVEAREKLMLEGISIEHIDMIYLKPLDKEMLNVIVSRFKQLITIEDGTIIGGLGSAVIEYIAESGSRTAVTRMGLPDSFVEHGTPKELYHECGIDAQSIYITVKKLLASNKLSENLVFSNH